MLDDLQLVAMLFGGRGGVFSRVSLIDKSQLDMFTSYLLPLSPQFAHLSTVLIIGRGHVQSRQVLQRAHHRMHLRSLALLGSVRKGAYPQLRRRLQDAAIDDYRRRQCLAPAKLAQQQAQVLDHHLKSNPRPSGAASAGKPHATAADHSP